MAGRTRKTKLPIERDGIKAENPENYYTFGDEIGKGKFSVVKRVTHKGTGMEYAAKIVKFDKNSLKFAIREYDMMIDGKLNVENKATATLHEAFLVQKYLILIITLYDGKTLLEYFGEKQKITEDDVAAVVKQLCSLLAELHSRNIVHLDIRPTNIRLHKLNELKLLDYNSSRQLKNKKAGEVVDVIGDTEFCAPEMLSFDKVQPGSDVWSVAVIMYILLSGISPYFYEDESKVSLCVEKVIFKIDDVPEFDNVTNDAKDFIKKIFKRGPENRMTAKDALDHVWLKDANTDRRKMSIIDAQETIKETDLRLYSEEEEEYIEASLVFRTFEEEEYISTESEEDEDESEESDKD